MISYRVPSWDDCEYRRSNWRVIVLKYIAYTYIYIIIIFFLYKRPSWRYSRMHYSWYLCIVCVRGIGMLYEYKDAPRLREKLMKIDQVSRCEFSGKINLGVLTVHMVGGMAICGGSEDVREGRIGIGGGGCGMIGGTLAPAISGRRNHDATEAH